MHVKRDRWPSRVAFIMAAIGSAVGVGNLWRFPYLSFQYGGGAFFIPYFVSLLFIGVPILLLEFVLGQVKQGGHLVCFGSMNKRGRGLGFAAPLMAMIVALYYCAVLGWSVVYLLRSFAPDLPWDVEASDAKNCSTLFVETVCNQSPTCVWTSGSCTASVLKSAVEFFSKALNLGATTDALTLEGSWRAILGSLGVWAIILTCLFKGTKAIGYVVYVTMTVPMLLLIVLLIKGITLDGSSDGITMYIGEWDTSILDKPDVWSAAAAQIFFSLGVCFGIMTAYASFNKSNRSVVVDGYIVAFTNSLVSIVAGFTVFSIAGFLAKESGVPIEDLKAAGPGLIFLTFPTGLSQFPTAAAHTFCVLFFLTFLLLGIDSAFSMVEAMLVLITDSFSLTPKSRRYALVGLCCIGFCGSLPFCSNVGLYLLDSVDYYLLNIGGLVIGFGECILAGWVYGRESQVDIVGAKAVNMYSGILGGGAVLGAIIASTIASNAMIVGGSVIALSVVIACIAAYLTAPVYTPDGDNFTGPVRLWWIVIGDMELLRWDLNGVLGNDTMIGSLPFIWSILIKYVAPGAILLMFCRNVFGEGFMNYEDYPDKYIWTGMVVAIAVVAAVLIGALFPRLSGWFSDEGKGGLTPPTDPSRIEPPRVNMIAALEVDAMNDPELL